MRPAPPTRRLVLATAGVALLRVARAQPGKRHRIAALAQGSRAYGTENWEAFRQGLRALGYGEADITIELRWADGRVERLPEIAVELVGLAPEVIVVGSGAAALAAKQATSTIPIVGIFADPVGAGLVASFPHPGGNVTGLSPMQEDTVAKELELLKTAAPQAERIAVLFDPTNPAHAGAMRTVRQAGQTVHTEIVSIEARAQDEIDGAFSAMTGEHADALVVLGGPLVMNQRRRIAELAASHKLPAIYYERELVMAGGLMSYGADLKDIYRRAAIYVDKILKGANPADLPVEQPTKFELVVNLKTAQALGLTIPPSILARADEVIE
jgi:putative tryptophan/tyrosine transport system substrate-binding protein